MFLSITLVFYYANEVIEDLKETNVETLRLKIRRSCRLLNVAQVSFLTLGSFLVVFCALGMAQTRPLPQKCSEFQLGYAICGAITYVICAGTLIRSMVSDKREAVYLNYLYDRLYASFIAYDMEDHRHLYVTMIGEFIDLKALKRDFHWNQNLLIETVRLGYYASIKACLDFGPDHFLWTDTCLDSPVHCVAIESHDAASVHEMMYDTLLDCIRLPGGLNCLKLLISHSTSCQAMKTILKIDSPTRPLLLWRVATHTPFDADILDSVIQCSTFSIRHFMNAPLEQIFSAPLENIKTLLQLHPLHPDIVMQAFRDLEIRKSTRLVDGAIRAGRAEMVYFLHSHLFLSPSFLTDHDSFFSQLKASERVNLENSFVNHTLVLCGYHQHMASSYSISSSLSKAYLVRLSAVIARKKSINLSDDIFMLIQSWIQVLVMASVPCSGTDA